MNEEQKPAIGTVKKFWTIRYTKEMGWGYYYCGRFDSKDEAKTDLQFGYARNISDGVVVERPFVYEIFGWMIGS